MNIIIYIIIFILFAVLLLWTWNNEKDFEKTSSKISFIIIGMLILSVITLIVFTFSKIGMSYPNIEMVREVRNMVLLIFVPINGYLSLPHIASLKSDIALGVDDKKSKRKIIILGIVFIVAFIIEIIYLKDFQKGIIQILNSK